MDDNNGDRPLRIVEFRAENTKVIKAVDIFPGDRDIIALTGKNKQGKSTILDAIWMALSGKSHIPDMPIRTGEKKAEIYLDLGDFKIIRKISRSGESLKVESSDGHQVTSPQKFLSSCLADLAHNPLEFMRMKSKEQLEIVQGLFPLPVNTVEIEKIAGLAAKTVKIGDNKALYLDNVNKALFEERTENNREVLRLEKVIESIQIPRHLEDLKVTPVIELFEERAKLEGQKKKNDDIRQKAESLRIELEEINKELLNNNTEITDLEKKFETLKQERVDLVSLSCDLQDKYFAESDKADELIEPDFSDIDARIKKVDEDNRQANKVIQDRTTIQKARADWENAHKDSEKLTSQMEALKAYKLRLVEQAKLPLTGLGFEDGRVIYNDLPLDQASTREQIEISCAICLAQHPRIGIVTIDIGWSELDKEGQKIICEFAHKNGAQFWVTQVSEEPGQKGFHIVAGELTAVDGVAVAEDCGDLPETSEASEENTDGILTVNGQGRIGIVNPDDIEIEDTDFLKTKEIGLW